jgi:hypothetical protein
MILETIYEISPALLQQLKGQAYEAFPFFSAPRANMRSTLRIRARGAESSGHGGSVTTSGIQAALAGLLVCKDGELAPLEGSASGL